MSLDDWGLVPAVELSDVLMCLQCGWQAPDDPSHPHCDGKSGAIIPFRGLYIELCGDCFATFMVSTAAASREAVDRGLLEINDDEGWVRWTAP